MSATSSVVIAIKAVDEASGAMDTIRASLGVFGGAIGELGGGFHSLGNIISGVAGAGVMGGLAAATGEVVRGLQDCFKAAKESEDVWNKLTGTVERSGAAWADVKDEIESFASSMEKMSKFSDEQVAMALKTLMDYGMNLDTAMKSLATTMDLAAAKQIDLETAAKAVGRAFEGNASLLIRMGVEVTKSKDDSVVFADAMTKLQEKFGGAAQNDLETYAGKQALVANAMDNLKEKIGGALIPVLSSFQDMMGNVVKGADALVTDLGKAWKALNEIPEVKTIAESLSGAFADLQKGFGTVADELAKTLMPLFKELWAALGDVWKALTPVIEAFGQIWKALTGFSSEGKNAYTIFNLIADVLKITIIPALTALVKGIELVTPVIKLLAEGFKQAVDVAIPAIKTIIDAVGGFITTVKDLLGGFYTWLVGGSFIQDTMAAAFTAFETGFTAIISGVSEWLGGIMDTFVNWGKGLTDFFSGIWNTMVDSVGKAISGITSEVKTGTDQVTSTFANLKNDLVGESIWTDMWKAMLEQASSSLNAITAKGKISVTEFERMMGELRACMLEGMQDAIAESEEGWEGGLKRFNEMWDEIRAAMRESFDDLIIETDQITKPIEDLSNLDWRPFDAIGWKTFGELLEKAGVSLQQFYDICGEGMPQAQSLADLMEKLSEESSEARSVHTTTAGAFLDLAKAGIVLDRAISDASDSITLSWNDIMDCAQDSETFAERLAVAVADVKYPTEDLSKALQKLGLDFKIYADGEVVLSEGLTKLRAAFESGAISSAEMVKALSGMGYETKKFTDNVQLTAVPALRAFAATCKAMNPDWDMLQKALSASGISVEKLSEQFGILVSSSTTVEEFTATLKKNFEEGNLTVDNLVISTDELSKTLMQLLAVTTQVAGESVNLWKQMESSAGSALDNITGKVRSAASEIKNLMSGLKDDLVGHSIWPDMWRDMVSQTSGGLDQVLSETAKGIGALERAFGGTAASLSAPVTGSPRAPMSIAGPQTISVDLDITIQHMTGEMKDIQKMAREVSRELGDKLAWRR